MSMQQPRHPAFTAVENFFGSPRFSAALTQTIIGAALGSLFLQQLIGWAGLLAILGTLVVLATLSFLARRDTVEWHGLLPISLLIFVGWAAISVFWSQYQWATFGSVVYFGTVTVLGIYVALIRDTIQIARAFGDVLRVALALSLVLEIFSGVLIDAPLRFLYIQGNLAQFGPIQGIFGTRNQLGVIALVAIVTFVTELRTRSIQRPIAIGSLVLAALMLALSRSPVAFGTFVVVALAAAALYGLRRVSAERKRFWQIGLLALTIAVGAAAWAARTPIINALSASAELKLRLQLWQPMRLLIPLHELEGWGWIGHWREDLPPFQFIPDVAATPASGMNAYLDVWLQLGLVGLAAFVGLVALTFIRSWLLASRQRSFVYAWPALVLVVLLVTGFAESSMLVEFGWLTFVVCCVKASRELSWRKAFAATRVAFE
ncbi:O-antigen ligase family protein [Glaciihabitans sp. UYNi722]|uniref:O-antigen ligase family protein n=1 Tax=Glaciihabitans sp. UYNi722 TaxID=3156344 RepID=UPI003396F615